MAKKVVYGISNVHYALWVEAQGSTEAHYDTPVAIPGARRITKSLNDSDNDFYADNVAYASFGGSTGGEGELEMAYIANDIKAALLGHIVDGGGGAFDDVDAQSPMVALMFQVESNDHPDRIVIYDVKFTDNDLEANTQTDSTDPDVQTMPFTYGVHEFEYGTGSSKRCTYYRVSDDTAGHTTYAGFFTEVHVPTPPSA